MKKIVFFAVFALISIAIGAQTLETSFFITKWNTGSETSITLPATGNYTVIWEKENNKSVKGSKSFNGITKETHPVVDFGSAGVYVLKIAATTGVFSFGFLTTQEVEAKKLLEVIQWGTNKWVLASGMFYGCENMDISAKDIPDFSKVQNISSMFYKCKNLKGENQDFNSWDVSKVSAMNMVFSGAENFNRPLDKWNTSNVKYFYRMFHVANAFNQPLNSWDVSSAINLKDMFNGAVSFNQPLDKWNTSNVEDMLGLFYGAVSFNQPLNTWKTEKVKTMTRIFTNATSFNQNLNGWSLKSIPVNSEDALSDMVSFTSMDAKNYDTALIFWANNADTPTGLTFGARGRKYSSAGQEARSKLITEKSWSIKGDSRDKNAR